MSAQEPAEPVVSYNRSQKDPVRMLTFGYVLALAIIGIMSVGIHLTIDQIVRDQDGAATVVSKSANQTMLAQRIGLLSTQYVQNKSNDTRQALKKAVLEMEALHNTLVRTGVTSKNAHQALPEQVRVVYFEPPYSLHEKMVEFMDRTESLVQKPVASISTTDADYLYIVRQVDGSLAQALDAAVDSYESTIVTKISKLQYFQRLAIFIIMATLIGEAFFIFMPLVRRIKNYAAELKRIAMTDLLTSVGNRRFLTIRGEQEIRRCRRMGKPLCLALLDLDHFKKINDNYGHQAGDYILQEFTHLAIKAIRGEDVIARIGGEEFAVLLPHTDLDGALKVTERIRKFVEQATLRTEKGHVIKMTVSIGLAEVDVRQDELDRAMVEADMALYEAKKKGRNRIVFQRGGQTYDSGQPNLNVVPINAESTPSGD